MRHKPRLDMNEGPKLGSEGRGVNVRFWVVSTQGVRSQGGKLLGGEFYLRDNRFSNHHVAGVLARNASIKRVVVTSPRSPPQFVTAA